MSQCGSRCQNLKYHRLFECLEKVSDSQNTAFNSKTEAENGEATLSKDDILLSDLDVDAATALAVNLEVVPSSNSPTYRQCVSFTIE